MRLDSVRELKLTLAESMAPTAEKAFEATALGVSAQPFDPHPPTLPSIAFGVTRRGPRDFLLAVRIQRRSLQEGDTVHAIRKRARGEVDVRYVGRLVKRTLWYRERNRPVRIGSTVGHRRVTAGTIGCFVVDREKAALILSNNHVLANENRCRRGDVVIQPGRLDGGQIVGDAVATLTRFVRLRKTGVNHLDCAVAALNEGIRFDPRLLRGLGKLAGVASQVDPGMKVAKVGRTTGLTRGRITAIEMDNVVVKYGLGNLRFDNQIEVESIVSHPFSDGGDSGSLIVDAKHRALALLFAGSDQGGQNGLGLTYGNPISDVLSRLEVSLLD